MRCPPTHTTSPWTAPPQGQPRGSPKTLARKRHGWLDHPVEAGTTGQSWVGRWHRVLPSGPLRVVIVRRPAAQKAHTSSQSKPPPLVEAFFTTALTLSLEAILDAYGDRWVVAIDIRDGQALYGLGQDQCRTWRRIVGANTFMKMIAIITPSG